MSEILAANADAKQAEFEDKFLKNRPQKALDDDEIEFLDDLEREKNEKFAMRKEQDRADLDAFKLAQVRT